MVMVAVPSPGLEVTTPPPPPTPVLPPLSTLPASTYPPSSYPPPSHFEAAAVVHPALVFPAPRTGQIQKALDGVVFAEPKRKRVFPPEAGVDYAAEDAVGGGARYDPRKERKLVLARLGPGGDAGEGKFHGEDAAKNDRVWLDARLQSILASAAGDDATTTSATAPAGKRSVRPSCIRLPATPYASLTVDQVLRRILPTPEDAPSAGNDDGTPSADPTVPTAIEEIPSSFEIAGHIAHVNLRDESLPYKYLIGKAILDKNRPKIKMVVNKIGSIENEFRTFPMEILAGDGLDEELVERLCATGTHAAVAPTAGAATEAGAERGAYSAPSQQVQLKIGPQHRNLMQVEVKEHGCRFKLDFARVYWNSRLQGEHDALVQHIVQEATEAAGAGAQDCVVADAMAGVGPFAVPLTSSNAPHYRGDARIVCHANDLNPVSYEYLLTNARWNRCFVDRLLTYNLDARAFIRNMNAEGMEVDHFIMNLPQLAPEFLDAFRGWRFRDAEKRPTIHVHCFGEKARAPAEADRAQRQIQERCATALGVDPACFSPSPSSPAEDSNFRVHVVRDVGPRKHMFRVSFRLPREVGQAKRRAPPAPASGSNAGETGDAALHGKTRDGKRDKVQGDDGGDGANDTTSRLSKRSKVEEKTVDENERLIV